MIDQLATLGKVNSIGRDGFVWWIGQVAPPAGANPSSPWPVAP